tara:strand:+ start:233 stop:448 length:216 start_codon:yes stop_codon:yes gene_type:complete
MNESEREAIEDLIVDISHVNKEDYAPLMKRLAGKYGVHEGMLSDAHNREAWVDGFIMALEWVLDKDDVEVV